jgi:hypothetical protein
MKLDACAPTVQHRARDQMYYAVEAQVGREAMKKVHVR